MKLSEYEKIKYFDRLWEITETCYTGIECPDRMMFDRLMRQGVAFIWYYGTPDSIQGYALVTPDPSWAPLLVSIAVMPSFQGVGVGKMILREVSNYYRSQGRQQIVLHCKTDNPAQILYFKEGYRVTAYLRNYYKPEGDGLEMRKML